MVPALEVTQQYLSKIEHPLAYQIPGRDVWTQVEHFETMTMSKEKLQD